jgi:uncharacterized membrane protein
VAPPHDLDGETHVPELRYTLGAMQTFLQMLHVLAAVFVVGPLALVPFEGLRGIRRRDADEVGRAATWTIVLGIGSVVVFLFGVVVTATSPRYTFRTTWVVISMTLYVVALVLIFAWAVPALRKAARMVGVGVLDQPAGTAPEQPDPVVTASGPQLATKGELDTIVGRVAAAGGVNLLLFMLITALMVVRPFGR